MKFLNETITENVEILLEGEGATKKMYIKGILMQGGVKNKNGRIYPVKILMKEAERYKREVVEQNQALGELNHPDRISVDPKEASHRITEMWTDGNNVLGRCLVLETPNGKILKALLEGGTKFGFSSRAIGSVKQLEDHNEVQEDFRLSCIDAVLNNSAPDAVMSHIMEEKNFTLFENQIVEVNQATEKYILEKHNCSCEIPAKKEIKKMSEADMLKAFESMVNVIEPKLQESKEYRKQELQYDMKKHGDIAMNHAEKATNAYAKLSNIMYHPKKQEERKELHALAQHHSERLKHHMDEHDRYGRELKSLNDED